MFKRGYTIIELLAVISTVGILATAATPYFNSLTNEAKNIKAEAEVKTVQSIVERYYEANGKLPASVNLLEYADDVNIAKKNIHDPFKEGKAFYEFEKGKLSNGVQYYIIYSKGVNGRLDHKVVNNRVVNSGDDIVASNLIVL